jgi:hypothetical protein
VVAATSANPKMKLKPLVCVPFGVVLSFGHWGQWLKFEWFDVGVVFDEGLDCLSEADLGLFGCTSECGEYWVLYPVLACCFFGGDIGHIITNEVLVVVGFGGLG